MAKDKRPIEQYGHLDKRRKNNPPAGLVTPETDRDGEKKTYAYDPHLDPQLVWAGKAEHTSFEVPTVSLHVHEHGANHGAADTRLRPLRVGAGRMKPEKLVVTLLRRRPRRAAAGLE